MNGLAKLNGDRVSVPGFVFRLMRGRDMVSLLCHSDRYPGAVAQLWHRGTLDEGGAEIHTRERTYAGEEVAEADCEYLPGGGPCYCNGSTESWWTEFAPLVAAGDAEQVFRLLAEALKNDAIARAFDAARS